ncbi:hypothetical protein C4D60_Mb09t08190 [Musa balbisiana]|uniref:Uncharacterized protein n=1 Tax=Musa balbisiana TaxID=52838 RepID=A0A4S8IF10_MUSBA|nr:hypothetical protein C4D60_Mb09t08190 [Musa balbisiana]
MKETERLCRKAQLLNQRNHALSPQLKQNTIVIAGRNTYPTHENDIFGVLLIGHNDHMGKVSATETFIYELFVRFF